MTRKERYQGIIEYFQEAMPNPETELMYDHPFQLLVAVILSAQCTDKRVNMVTPKLFQALPTPEVMAQTDVEDIFQLIRSISYPNNKAKHLRGMANMLIDDFNGEVPMTVKELMLLPGVGRKTANVITSVLDGQPNMAVDTHVYRLAHRIGLVPKNATTPLKVEQVLIKNFPDELIHKAHHWLILHGRYICIARNPKCEECGITIFCKSFGK